MYANNNFLVSSTLCLGSDKSGFRVMKQRKQQASKEGRKEQWAVSGIMTCQGQRRRRRRRNGLRMWYVLHVHAQVEMCKGNFESRAN
jgi:hypothetical protein